MVCDNNDGQGNGSNNDYASSTSTNRFSLQRVLLAASSSSNPAATASAPPSEALMLLASGQRKITARGNGDEILAMDEQKEAIGKILQAALDLVEDDHDELMGEEENCNGQSGQ